MTRLVNEFMSASIPHALQGWQAVACPIESQVAYRWTSCRLLPGNVLSMVSQTTG
jgi:hypothetical protein